MRFRRLTAGVAAVAAAAALLGTAAAPERAAATTCALPAADFGPAFPPIASSRQLPALGPALSQIAFEPRLPAGKPYRVYVSRDAKLERRQLGLSYRGAAGSWFLVTERPATESRARFEAGLRELGGFRPVPAPCLRGFKVIRLADGGLALLTRGDERRTLRFQTGGIQIMLLAAPTSASVAQLTALANSLGAETR